MDILLFLESTEVSIPVFQIVLLLILSTLSLLFGRMKLALLVNYVFTLYWGYMLNRDRIFGEGLEQITYFGSFYFLFGLFVAVLASIGFLIQKE